MIYKSSIQWTDIAPRNQNNTLDTCFNYELVIIKTLLVST